MNASKFIKKINKAIAKNHAISKCKRNVVNGSIIIDVGQVSSSEKDAFRFVKSQCVGQHASMLTEAYDYGESLKVKITGEDSVTIFITDHSGRVKNEFTL